MKHIIFISIFFFFFACNSNPKYQSQSYLNDAAAVQITDIPFNLESAKLVSSVIRPNDKQTILVLSEATTPNKDISNKTNFQKGIKWLIIYWEQTDDPVWIGARIPGQYLFADLVQFNEDGFTFNRYNNSGRLLRLNENERQIISEFILSIEQI